MAIELQHNSINRCAPNPLRASGAVLNSKVESHVRKSTLKSHHFHGRYAVRQLRDLSNRISRFGIKDDDIVQHRAGPHLIVDEFHACDSLAMLF